MEIIPLLQTPLRTRKDVVRVLAQARQIAKMLRFSQVEQIEIGCAAFSLSVETFRAKKREAICFHLVSGALMVGTVPSRNTCGKLEAGKPAYRIRKDIPEAAVLSRDDFVWIIAQLQILLDVDVLEVMQKQNDDLLELVKALDCCRNDLDRLRHSGPKPSAA